MSKVLKGLFAFSLIPVMMVGCTTTSQKKATIHDIPRGHRIHIPQETISIERPVRPKITPSSYLYWLENPTNRAQVQDYQAFLTRNDVANIVPNYELLRTARDWQKCGRSEYAVPNRELWNNALPTLRVLKYLVAAKILTDFEVTSVYRDLPLNQCAGGANSSRHLFNSAIDFRIGPEIPQPQDYAFIENTKFRLCQFWSQHGQSLNMGLGLYSTGQIHIDTQGYRTWGPDHSRNSSMCNF